MSFPTERPRRLRQNQALRRLVRETRLAPESLVAPIFVSSGVEPPRQIPSLPGQCVLNVADAVAEARALDRLGVGGLLLFGVSDQHDRKDEIGSGAWDPDGPVPTALRALKAEALDLSLWADVCLCAYTSHGHCGVLADADRGQIRVDNDRTLPLLEKTAVTYSDAGADVIAPSDMMDGRVGAIRRALDTREHTDTVICSYAVKYASAFYGPFRDAAGSAPKAGDRRGYQMDPANVREAVREALLDVEEGADLVMVKPALAYLDVIARVKDHVKVPVAAYNVSGEYALVRAGSERGWIDACAAMMEILLSIRRAGADVTLTYFAKEVASLLG